MFRKITSTSQHLIPLPVERGHTSFEKELPRAKSFGPAVPQAPAYECVGQARLAWCGHQSRLKFTPAPESRRCCGDTRNYCLPIDKQKMLGNQAYKMRSNLLKLLFGTAQSSLAHMSRHEIPRICNIGARFSDVYVQSRAFPNWF